MPDLETWQQDVCALARVWRGAKTGARPDVFRSRPAKGRDQIVAAKYPHDMLHAAQLPRCGAYARAARAQAADYRIIDVQADCGLRVAPLPGGIAAGQGILSVAMAVGTIACLASGRGGITPQELARIIGLPLGLPSGAAC